MWRVRVRNGENGRKFAIWFGSHRELELIIGVAPVDSLSVNNQPAVGDLRCINFPDVLKSPVAIGHLDENFFVRRRFIAKARGSETSFRDSAKICADVGNRRRGTTFPLANSFVGDGGPLVIRRTPLTVR